MNLSHRIAASTALLLLSGAALAQSSQLPGIPPAPTFTIPAPDCEKPPTTPGLQPDARAIKRWNSTIDAYKKCNADYQKALGESINAYTADVNMMVEAAKKNISDYNAFGAQVRKDNDMDDDEASDGKTVTVPANPGKK